MLNKEEFKSIEALKSINPETYAAVQTAFSNNAIEVSEASHTIKNYVAYIKMSYEMIQKNKPDIKQYAFWGKMNHAICELITYLDRTTEYRYSKQPIELDTVNINDIIFSMPEYMDEYLDEDRIYSFDVNEEVTRISANKDKMVVLFKELLSNAYNVTSPNDEIMISSKPINDNSQIGIEISYHDSESEKVTNIDLMSEPFFTTKESHVGVGLSMVRCISLMHNIDVSIKNNLSDKITTVSMIIPVL